ncbi:MAG: isopeptide-forming domain-containing fimbrial protein [Clostridia bacterium]|nr:isopeptide-forming domain-containing fimbrial protein [Clostridia bacterium]
MKAIAKVLATLLCLCLLFGCVSIAAFAETPTGSITIQNPSHSDATVGGKTFNVYKVFNATTSGTSTSYSWYEDTNGNVPFYDFFFGPNGVVEKNKTDGNVQDAVNYVTNIQKNEGNLALSQLAEALHTYIVEKNTPTVTIPTVIDPVVVGAEETSVKIAGLDYGYYLVYDNTNLTGNSSAVRSAVMLTTVNKDAVVTLKANRPEIDKTVLENDGTTYGKGTSAMIGEDVTFKIETIVPSHTLYTSYQYYINDTLPEGLTLKADTIKVYLNDFDTLLVANTDYKLSVPGDEGAHFKVDFTTKMMGDGQYAIGDILIIVYDAHVTDGIKAQAANTNTATLTYSNDPTKEDSFGTTSSTANVYSYQFVFSKFAEDTSGVFKNVRLIGAEFQLYKIEDGTRTLVNFTTEDATNDGAAFIKYIVAEQAVDGVTVDTLKVHEAGDETITLDHLNFGGHRGDVVIFGLSEGKYELVETKAPDGYILPKTAFSVEIIDAIGELGSVGTLSVTSSHDTNDAGSIVNTNGMGELILTVWADITNAPGSALPETGGMGTTLFTVLGIVLMAGAIAFFTSRKRSSVA